MVKTKNRKWMSAKQAGKVYGLNDIALKIGKEEGILKNTKEFYGIKLYDSTELCELKHKLGKPYIVQWVDWLENQDAESIYFEIWARSPGSADLFMTDYYDDFRILDSARGWVRLKEGDFVIWADGRLYAIPCKLGILAIKIAPLLLGLEEVEPGVFRCTTNLLDRWEVKKRRNK